MLYKFWKVEKHNSYFEWKDYKKPACVLDPKMAWLLDEKNNRSVNQSLCDKSVASDKANVKDFWAEHLDIKILIKYSLTFVKRKPDDLIW